MKDKAAHILFLVPYPMKHAPSQRFRVELFLPELDKAGITYKVQSFLDEQTWDVLYKGGGFVSKAWGVIKGFARRWKIVLTGLSGFDFVFIHREAAPIGPPVFEWLISKIFRKKIIYDFDDAIWIPNTSKENKLVSWIKACWKVKYICTWADKVVGGNDYLCEYARSFNKQVVKIPTCVDTVNGHNRLKDQHTDKMIVGWTGSHSTMKFLDEIVPVLEELQAKYEFEFVVISNKPPAFELPLLRFIPWKEETETEDLLQLNIGVMPLEKDPWCEGKCGFKLIQYLALGIPAVASPVGVNTLIVEQGKTGFLCEVKEEWSKSLAFLIEQEDKRTLMGKLGRNKIENEYSISSQSVKFAALFSLNAQRSE
jgi:glycosyltransferase involved in cell wall biosynthesis